MRDPKEVPATDREIATVLLVDDEAASLRMMQRVLLHHGIQSHTAPDAASALRLLHSEPGVQVVLTDLVMPGMDGLELLRQIRRDFPDKPWLQVLLLTGHASIDSAVAAMRASAANYLVKPVPPATLAHEMRESLRRAHEARVAAMMSGVDSDAGDLAYVVATARELLRGAESPAGTGGDAMPSPGAVRRWLQTVQTDETAPHVLSHIRTLLGTRAEFFSGIEMDEVTWQILLELADAAMRKREVSVSSVCLASGAPTTTALRRIDTLRAAGLVDRYPDAHDGRRTNVTLTPAGLERMTGFLRTIARTSASSRAST